MVESIPVVRYRCVQNNHGSDPTILFFGPKGEAMKTQTLFGSAKTIMMKPMDQTPEQ
jgi:hypothetical protein